MSINGLNMLVQYIYTFKNNLGMKHDPASHWTKSCRLQTFLLHSFPIHSTDGKIPLNSQTLSGLCRYKWLKFWKLTSLINIGLLLLGVIVQAPHIMLNKWEVIFPINGRLFGGQSISLYEAATLKLSVPYRQRRLE